MTDGEPRPSRVADTGRLQSDSADTTKGPRVEAVVDHDAIAGNVALLSGLAAGSGAATMAVVKADGYGHGAVDVARTALGSGATWLGVCTLDEAADLRAAGLEVDGRPAPVLSWLHVPGEDYDAAVATGVDLGVADLDELDAITAAARRTGRRARLHLKIDTGLSRNGCPPDAWPGLLAAVAAAGDAVEPVAVWSHLSHGDVPGHPSLDRQATRLGDAWRAAQSHLGTARLLRHLANSAAVLTRPDLHLDLVRPGIAVYGLDPLGAADHHGLRPSMTFRSRVALVKTVSAGEGVSYGHQWVTTDDRVLALVPVGYADGVPRRLGDRRPDEGSRGSRGEDRQGDGGMSVQVAGARRPVVGRVCMDQVVVDCGPADAPLPVRAGDEVVLFGPGERGEPTAADWADATGTIHYEIVTGVGCRPRVRRTPRVGAGSAR